MAFRLSIRALLILTALLGAYAAGWWPTKTLGEKDINERLQPCRRGERSAMAVAPLFVACDERAVWDADGRRIFGREEEAKWGGFAQVGAVRCYYFWCFGLVVKLPFEGGRVASARTSARLTPTKDSLQQVTRSNK